MSAASAADIQLFYGYSMVVIVIFVMIARLTVCSNENPFEIRSRKDDA